MARVPEGSGCVNPQKTDAVARLSANVSALSVEEKHALAAELTALVGGEATVEFSPNTWLSYDDHDDHDALGHIWIVDLFSNDWDCDYSHPGADDRRGPLPILLAESIERTALHLLGIALRFRAAASQPVDKTRQEASQGCEDRFAVVQVTPPRRVLVRSVSKAFAKGYAGVWNKNDMETIIVPDQPLLVDEAQILALAEAAIAGAAKGGAA